MSRALFTAVLLGALLGVPAAVAQHYGLLDWLPSWMLPPGGDSG